MKVLAIICDGFEEVEGVCSFGLLRRAKIDIDIVSTKSEVVGMNNIYFNNLKTLEEINIDDYSCLLLPGGKHYKILESTETIVNIIKNFMDNNKIVCAICAAPTILGRLGYLNGKKYTCFTSMNKDFGGEYIDSYTVIDGNLITGKSAAASIEFAFAIINKLGGKELEQKVKEDIYY